MRRMEEHPACYRVRRLVGFVDVYEYACNQVVVVVEGKLQQRVYSSSVHLDIAKGDKLGIVATRAEISSTIATTLFQ